MRIRVFVGTYTSGSSRGIYTFEFDLSTGITTAVQLAAVTVQPSFLALHPHRRVLYAVNELQTFDGHPGGAVSSFAVDPVTGHLTFVNQQPSGGRDPCFVLVDAEGAHVFVANYTSGTVTMLPLDGDGRLQRVSCTRQRVGSGPLKDRQDGPHAHTVRVDPSRRFLLWTDLGTDWIEVDRIDRVNSRLEPNTPDGVPLAPGSGPRHLAWHPSGRVLYALNELSSSVMAFRFDDRAGTLDPFQLASARAPDASGQNTAAEIQVRPDGRFLYTSNRGDDDIAVFAIDADTLGLTSVGRRLSGGRTPRNFAIDPLGHWLLAANQASEAISVFRLDATSGLPIDTGGRIEVPAPVHVLFAASAT